MASGIDNLLDALQQSGVDVDDIGGDRGTSPKHEGKAEEAPSEGGSGSGSGSGDGRASSSRGDMPFGGGGFPFGGGGFPFGGMGGRGGSGGGDGEPPTIEFAGSLGDRMASWSKRTIIIAIIVAVLIIGIAYWWFHPPISINSIDAWVFVTICILVPTFLLSRSRSRRYETGDSKLDPNPSKSKSFKVLSFVPVIILVLGLVGWVTSLDLFPGNAKKYAEVLKTDTMTFAEDIQ